MSVYIDIKPGFHFEGDVNLPSFIKESNIKSKNSIKLHFNIEKKGEMKTPMPIYYNSSELIEFEHHDGTHKYKCIVKDKKKFYWDEKLEKLSFSSALILCDKNVEIAVPTLFIGGQTHLSAITTYKDFYENTIDQILDQLREIFSCVTNLKVNLEEKNESYRNLVCLKNKHESSNRNIFCAREFFINYLNFLKSFKRRKVEKFSQSKELFDEFYPKKTFKNLIGDYKESSSYSIEEVKLYTQRCFDVWNEFLLFKNESYYYFKVLPEIDNKNLFSMKTNKVAIFTFYFKDYKEKQSISKDNLRFFSALGYDLRIDFDNITIFNDYDWETKYIAIDIEELKKKNVKTIAIERLEIVIQDFMNDLIK